MCRGVRRKDTAVKGGWLIYSALTGALTDAIDFHGQQPNNVDNTLAGQYAVGPNNGEEIIKIQATHDYLFVYKERSVWVIEKDTYGTPASCTQISAEYSTRSVQGAFIFNNNATYFDQAGLFTSNGGQPLLTSYNLGDLVTNIPEANLNTVSTAEFNYYGYIAVGDITEDRRYMTGLTQHTYKNSVLVMNYLTQRWFLYTYPYTISTMGIMLNVNKKRNLYFGDTSGNTYYLDPTVSSDNGQPIDEIIQYRYMYFTYPGERKEFKDTCAVCRYAMKGKIMYSLIGDTSTPYEFLMDAPAYSAKVNVPENSSAYRGISYLFTENSTSPCEWIGLEQEYSLEGM